MSLFLICLVLSFGFIKGFVISRPSLNLKINNFRPLNAIANPTIISESEILSELLKQRIIFIGKEITHDVANLVASQLLFLSSIDKYSEITFYINSKGGSADATLAIFDAMQMLPCDINTVCIGSVASTASFLLSAGTKGKRKSLPNSRIMLHQPLGKIEGDANTFETSVKTLLESKNIMASLMASFCNKPISQLQEDLERDFYLSPEQALHYGLIDSIIPHKSFKSPSKIPEIFVPTKLNF